MADVRDLYNFGQYRLAGCLHVVPAAVKHSLLNERPELECKCQAGVLVSNVPALKFFWKAIWLHRCLCFAEAYWPFVTYQHRLEVWNRIIILFVARDSQLRTEHGVEAYKLERNFVWLCYLVRKITTSIIGLASSRMIATAFRT